MSHGKERTEKDCLNCGAVVQGPYCHICGQANTVPEETLWSLIQHFVYDITHFDGKFFSSLKFLLLRPGFLSYEYVRGRRASYLNPVRMYVFTAAIFFVIIFSFKKFNNILKSDGLIVTEERAALSRELQHASTAEQMEKARLKLRKLDTSQVIGEKFNYLPYDSAISDSVRTGITKSLEDSTYNTALPISFYNNFPTTLAEYEKREQAKPESERHGVVVRYGIKKAIELNQRYKGRKSAMWKDIGDKFLHSLPTLMFVSMPLVAAFLTLLYFRHKNHFFAGHGILIIHIYIALYLLILFSLGLNALINKFHLAVLEWINTFIIIYMFYYVYKSLRYFYQQGRLKTIFKYSLLLIFSAFLMAVLSVAFVVNTFFML